MNFTIQCKDKTSGKVGCFMFDMKRFYSENKFYAISPVFSDLLDLFKWAKENNKQLINHNGTII